MEKCWAEDNVNHSADFLILLLLLQVAFCINFNSFEFPLINDLNIKFDLNII